VLKRNNPIRWVVEVRTASAAQSKPV